MSSAAPTDLDLSDYEPRAPGSEPDYILIEQAMIDLARQPAAATRLIERAIDRFVARGDLRGEARARAKAAIVFRHAGDPLRAEGEAVQALAWLGAHPDGQFAPTAALELGQLYAGRGDYEAALETYHAQIADLGRPHPGEPDRVRWFRACFRDCAANVHATLGELEDAVALRALAIPEMTSLESHHDALVALSNLAQDLLRLDELDKAYDAIGDAESVLQRIPGDRRGEITLALVAGRWAIAKLQRIDDVDERGQLLDVARFYLWRAVILSDFVNDTVHAATARLLLADVELDFGEQSVADHLIGAADRRLPADAGQLRRQWDALMLRSMLSRSDPEAGADVRRMLDSGQLEVTVDRADRPAERDTGMTDVSALLPFAWARIDGTRALREIERLKAADLVRLLRMRAGSQDAEALRRLEREVDDELPDLRPVSAHGATEAFVDFYVEGTSSLAFLQLPDEPLRVFDLDVSASEISDAVTRLRRSFDGHGLRLGIDPKRPWKVKLDYVNELATRLLPFASVLDEVDVVCFFAHGALHHFPFHAAHVDRDEPLIAGCAVTYGLSRRLLALARARDGHTASAPRPRSALVVGVPSIGEPRPELFLGDDAFLRSFGIDAAAPLYPGETQVEDVLRAMTSVDLLHFNCHGMFSASRPLDSSLLLSDGTGGPRRGWDAGSDETFKHLSARRLFGTNTVARTAILRACSSGATNVRVGDEQEGILRALFYAGLSSCVVARWKIDTESSRVLIRAMYDEWLRPETDVPLAQALRRAMLRLLTQPEAEHYRHPYHWAPFSLVGDWR